VFHFHACARNCTRLDAGGGASPIRGAEVEPCVRPRGVHSPSTFWRPPRLPGNLLQLQLLPPPLPFAPFLQALLLASLRVSGSPPSADTAVAARTGDLRRVQPPPPVIAGRAGLEPAERSPPPSAGKRHARPLLPPSEAPPRAPGLPSLRPDVCAICSTKRRSARNMLVCCFSLDFARFPSLDSGVPVSPRGLGLVAELVNQQS
jgi:hypothetical protein